MQLTKRDRDIVVFALNFLRSNLDEVQDSFAEPGVRPSISLPTENELDNICVKLEKIENG